MNHLSEKDRLAMYQVLSNWRVEQIDETEWCFITNRVGEIVYLLKPHEVPQKDIIGMQWQDLFFAQDIANIKDCFAAGNNKIILSNLMITSGELRDKQFNVVIEQFEVSDEFYFAFLLQDISMVNLIKTQLISAENLKQTGQIAAELVHEIRNPLTSLKGFLTLIQAGIEQKEEYYQVMIREIERLEKITSELLQLSKPIKNGQSDIALQKIIDDILILVRSQTIMNKVTINVLIEDEIILYCNEQQIKQVFLNLIKNGAESMEYQGNIDITATVQDECVTVKILDDGPGMSEDMIKEAKTPFYTTKKDGTGLGLVITEHLLEINDGYLAIIKEQNEVTSFIINLPLYNHL